MEGEYRPSLPPLWQAKIQALRSQIMGEPVPDWAQERLAEDCARIARIMEGEPGLGPIPRGSIVTMEYRHYDPATGRETPVNQADMVPRTCCAQGATWYCRGAASIQGRCSGWTDHAPYCHSAHYHVGRYMEGRGTDSQGRAVMEPVLIRSDPNSYWQAQAPGRPAPTEADIQRAINEATSIDDKLYRAELEGRARENLEAEGIALSNRNAMEEADECCPRTRLAWRCFTCQRTAWHTPACHAEDCEA